MITLMASSTSTPIFLCSSSSTQRRSTTFSFSASLVLYPKTSKSRLSTSISQLGLGHFSPWNGLRHLGIFTRQKFVKIETKGRCKGKVVYASLFGVGAPEALVIGVVALLVFGPKGLAEVARNLGKTLREFQPTIRELQEVSREFKSTLEREIGLDDIPTSTQNTYNSNTTKTNSASSNTENPQAMIDPNGSSPTTKAYSSEEYLKITEEQIKASAVQSQEQTPPQENQSETQPQPQENVAATVPPPQKSERET
ncbi:hypothetical protein HHK36_000194 [Tetracentron sinense]|uniref:Sec-independent protein translocase protein TATB, chloroplastic n=1 Tax=Tetracentron sinense TaxID=13715 RepID=A0A835DTI9_TETSI|nr:hypothetical protein HHK36_000194 [Tetracentron sinense]